jgi:hypothetical protein
VKTVAIVQSNYVPWKGYFDLIHLADEFVLLEDVQFTRRDWRNRNRIKTPQGPIWLTIPVEVKGRYHQTIRETKIAELGWADRHLSSLRHSYARAPHFRELEPLLESIYADASAESNLSAVNRVFIDAVCALLAIDSKISTSADFAFADDPTERLVTICRQAGASRYLSGPSASAYLDEERFRREGIDVAYMSYEGYPEYPQLHPPFEHAVSILDLLLHTGSDARSFLKSF